MEVMSPVAAWVVIWAIGQSACMGATSGMLQRPRWAAGSGRRAIATIIVVFVGTFVMIWGVMRISLSGVEGDAVLHGSRVEACALHLLNHNNKAKPNRVNR